MQKQEFTDAADNKITITINGPSATISAGGNGHDGWLRLKDKNGKERAYFSAYSQLSIRSEDELQRVYVDSHANLSLGGNGAGGDIALHPTNSHAAIPGKAATITVKLSGDKSEIALRNANKNRVRLDGLDGNIWIGGNGSDGELFLFDNSGDNATKAKATIHLDGHAGDIILKNADCAEEFDISDLEDISAGSVMVLDAEGKLRQSYEPYDRRVAGVISGAGDYRPGIILDRKHAQPDRKPLALVGKVFCRVDAHYSPIEVGDLLTTSATPGHAMKANDPLRAFGAVIGKALRPLRSGADLIPILVALQ